MNQILGFVVGLLQSALSLLGFVQTHPDLPPAQHDQAVEVAQQAITTATNAIASTTNSSSNIQITSPVSGSSHATSDTVAIQWVLPQTFKDLFQNKIVQTAGITLELDGQTGKIGSISDGFAVSESSYQWRIQSDIDQGFLKIPNGTYRIVAHGYYQPANFTCDPNPIYHKDCRPVYSTADQTLIEKARQYMGSSGSFTINSSQGTALSVPGMSKYTDPDFGFSFWYPIGWTVSSTPVAYPNVWGGTIKKELTVLGHERVIHITEFVSSNRSIALPAGACGTCAPITYYFDADAHMWMTQLPSGVGAAGGMTQEQFEKTKLPEPADISLNTMGGLHMFHGGTRFGSTVIPLSARNFLYIYSSSQGEYNPEQPLANTILATDISVATPMSAAEQIKIIQAEKDAYAGQ